MRVRVFGGGGKVVVIAGAVEVLLLMMSCRKVTGMFWHSMTTRMVLFVLAIEEMPLFSFDISIDWLIGGLVVDD